MLLRACKVPRSAIKTVINFSTGVLTFGIEAYCTRRKFLREILYRNIVIIAIQHSKMYFVDAFGDFSDTVG